MEDGEQAYELCPICEKQMCNKHLLAIFDGDKAEGLFGMGLVGGALLDVTEIGEIWEQACLTWVQSVRAAGKPGTPKWIAKEPLLLDYYKGLSGVGSFGPKERPFDVKKFNSDDDAAHDLRSDFDDIHYTTVFLEVISSRCGWSGMTSCPSSEYLRHGGVFRNGGSGSSGVQFKQQI
jgi:hypothetical protein